MKFQKIEVQAGGFWVEKRAGLPSYASDQEGRVIYDTVDDSLNIGIAAGNDFYQIFDQMHDATLDTPGAFSLGDAGHWWLNVHARDFWVQDNGAFHGEIDGTDADFSGAVTMHGAQYVNYLSVNHIIGNIYDSSQVNMILENGTGFSSWYKGDIRTDDGDLVLWNGDNNPAAATFSGVATAAKYS